MLVFKEKTVKDLIKLVGEENVLTDEVSLKACEGDLNRSYAKAFGVYSNPLPIAVVKVTSTKKVAEVLKYCNENRIIVIPRTGATSGEGLLEVREEKSITLDVSPMNKLIEVDTYNRMATVQCGFLLQTLEEIANKEGLTTGHSPQSRPLAHMGGLVATRSIGQFSTYYGGIEDMLCGLEAVLPDGRIIRIRNVPRRACGPDLRHLFLGSEGALGVITEVTVKLFPYYPDDMWKGGYIVKNMETGFKIIRDIIAAGYKPSVVRLYDKPDFDYNFGSITLKEEESFMFFTAESPAAVAKATGEGIHKIALEHGGEYIGTKAVDHWLEHRFDLCNKFGSEEVKEHYRQLKTIYTTTEISASWTEIVEIYKDVMTNVPKKISNLVMLGGHVSHSYINGTNIYFVYQLKIESPETSYDEHTALVKAICDEVIKYPTGGVVHHHGMGKQRVCYSKQEHGSSYVLLEAIKNMMDPNNIMCRGNLIQVYDK